MAASGPPELTPAVAEAMGRLQVDGATAEVVCALQLAGLDSILLKGPAVARWLYDQDETRAYVDCDLLVCPTDRGAAEEVLADLGFGPEVDERQMPRWWREHSVGWRRESDGAVVDLHRTVPGLTVDPERVWATLSAEVEPIVVAGLPLQTLTIPGRALHVALHAAQHGVAGRYSLADLELALSRADQATWQAAADLAVSLEATAAFAGGLRMLDAGRVLAEKLNLATDRPVDVALRATSSPPVALGFDQLAGASGLRERLHILARKVVPPPAFMHVWSPLARRGRLGLALAYAWRPLWLLRNTPAGFRAWRAARGDAARTADHGIPPAG